MLLLKTVLSSELHYIVHHINMFNTHRVLSLSEQAAVAMQISQDKVICFVTGQTRKTRPIRIIPVRKIILLHELNLSRFGYPGRFVKVHQSE